MNLAAEATQLTKQDPAVAPLAWFYGSSSLLMNHDWYFS
jgi:hypothetical protein